MKAKEITRPQSKILPNSYQSPNFLVDEIMRYLSGDEQKCIDVICRKTFGWQKRSDRIAKRQLEKITGITDVDNPMRELQKYGLVIRVSESVHNLGTEWSIQIDDSLIDLQGLQDRKAKKKEVNTKKTAQARAKRGRGDVPQPHHVPQPIRGDVPQPTQKPLSKTKEPPYPLKGGRRTFENWKDTPQEAHKFFEAWIKIFRYEPKGRMINNWLRTFTEWIKSGYSVKQTTDAAHEHARKELRLKYPSSINYLLFAPRANRQQDDRPKTRIEYKNGVAVEVTT